MTPENFCYWLQGFIEMSGLHIDCPISITPRQVEIIKDHLKLVFEKKTPDIIAPNNIQQNPEQPLVFTC